MTNLNNIDTIHCLLNKISEIKEKNPDICKHILASELTKDFSVYLKDGSITTEKTSTNDVYGIIVDTCKLAYNRSAEDIYPLVKDKYVLPKEIPVTNIFENNLVPPILLDIVYDCVKNGPMKEGEIRDRLTKSGTVGYVAITSKDVKEVRNLETVANGDKIAGKLLLYLFDLLTLTDVIDLYLDNMDMKQQELVKESMVDVIVSKLPRKLLVTEEGVSAIMDHMEEYIEGLDMDLEDAKILIVDLLEKLEICL